jgi:large subunit ribosomal protein L28
MSSLRHLLHKATVVSHRQLVAKTTAIQSSNTLLAQTSSSVSSSISQLSSNPAFLTQSRQRSNRSRRGLYDGKDIQTGNNVSFSKKATKRKFKPNVFKKRLYSEILGEMIQFHVTTSALRTIDKMGGLDNYVLSSKYVTEEGEGGEVKRRILERMEYCERVGEDVLPLITLPKAALIANAKSESES